MSDDPETVRQIAELARDDRPLLVLDVDEVVLEFVAPFIAYLDHRGYGFSTRSFRLHGNVALKETGETADNATVSALLDDFFSAQEEWQTAAPGAVEAITGFGDHAEIVMLTAMPHIHRERRRSLLNRLGLPFPLVTTETPKGPAVTMLAGERSAPVAFVDDIPHNLASVAKAFERAHLFHLMANAQMRSLLPAFDGPITRLDGWDDASVAIARALEIG